MSKFRTRTTEVEAALFDGKFVGQPDPATLGGVIPQTCPAWFPAVMEEKAPNDFGWSPGDVCTLGDKIYYAIEKHGETQTVTIHPGDWIIRKPSGRLSRVSADEFAATYEPV